MGFLEIKDLSHLLEQKRGLKNEHTNNNWRESYYFNATDEKRQISLITTIGILPNKGRCSGFVIIIKNKKIALVKLLITNEIRWHETDRFSLKGLSYQIEGIDWRLRYNSKKCKFNLLFRPINEFYAYEKGKNENNIRPFKNLASQHIEQAGLFEGDITLKGKQINFGPSPGHRDHSWGVRDWSSVDSYWLFSCTFGQERAFNLWRGSIQNDNFDVGYVFDSGINKEIISSNIKGHYKSKGKEPLGAEISFIDENNKKHKVRCEVLCSIPIPLNKCIIYETIARMQYDNYIGYGLLERLVNDKNPLHKLQSLLEIKRRGGG